MSEASQLTRERTAAPPPNAQFNVLLSFVMHLAVHKMVLQAQAPSSHGRQQVSCPQHGRENSTSLTLSPALGRGQLRVRR